MSGVPYTKEQLAFMEKHGADMTTTELTNALNKAFSTRHTAGSVRTTLKNMGILKSKETRARNCAMNGEPIGSAKIIGGYRYIKVRKSSASHFVIRGHSMSALFPIVGFAINAFWTGSNNHRR